MYATQVRAASRSRGIGTDTGLLRPGESSEICRSNSAYLVDPASRAWIDKQAGRQAGRAEHCTAHNIFEDVRFKT